MAKKIVQPVEVQASVKGDSSVKSFKAQIKEAQQEALRLAAAFGETDSRTLAAAKRVAELKDRMEDVNATIAGLHPDKFQAIANITGTLANGFAAAQGAAALLGGESEDLQKAMLRVQGAMAFAQGVAGLKDLQFQFAALQGIVVNGFTAMKAAIGSTGIGAVLIALGAAVTYVAMNWKELTGQLSESEKAAKAAANVMREGAASVEKQRIEIGYYQKIINDTNKSEQERITAFNKLKELVPTLTDNEINNAAALKNTNAELQTYVKNAILRAQMDALIAKQAENNNKIQEIQNSKVSENVGLIEEFGNSMLSLITLEDPISRGMRNVNTGIKNRSEAVNTLTEENKALEASMKAIQDQLLATDKATADAAAAAEAAAAKEEKRKQDKEAQRKKAEEDAKKAEEQRKQDLVNLREREIAMTELEADGLGKRQRLFGLAWQQRLKELKEKGYSEIEIQKIWQAEMDKIRTTWNNEQAAKQKSMDDLMKSDREKAVQAELDFINARYDAEEVSALKAATTKEEADKALEAIRLQRQQNELQALKDAGKSTLEIEKQIEADRIKNLDESAAKQKEIDKAVADTKKQAYADVMTASSALIELIGQQTVAGKAIALAQIAADTGVAIAKALNTTSSPSADNVATGGLAGIAKYAAISAAILSASARAVKIVKSGNVQPGGGGAMSMSGGGAMRPSMPSTAAGLPGGSEMAGGAAKVFVTESDISATQGRVKALKAGSVI